MTEAAKTEPIFASSNRRSKANGPLSPVWPLRRRPNHPEHAVFLLLPVDRPIRLGCATRCRSIAHTAVTVTTEHQRICRALSILSSTNASSRSGTVWLGIQTPYRFLPPLVMQYLPPRGPMQICEPEHGHPPPK